MEIFYPLGVIPTQHFNSQPSIDIHFSLADIKKIKLTKYDLFHFLKIMYIYTDAFYSQQLTQHILHSEYYIESWMVSYINGYERKLMLHDYLFSHVQHQMFQVLRTSRNIVESNYTCWHLV